MKLTRKKFFILLLLSASVTLILISAYSYKTKDKRKDFIRIDSEQYDTVLLSMFPITTYPQDFFYKYLLKTPLFTDYIIPDFKTFDEYVQRICSSNNTVGTIYFCFLPDKITAPELNKLIGQYPAITFELIMAYPNSFYWTTLSDDEYLRILDAYCAVLSTTELPANANLYCFSDCDFLISNPSLYSNYFLVSEDAAFFLVSNSTRSSSYLVTQDNTESYKKNLRHVTSELRNTPPDYPDLSDKTFFFLGDSVIGNFKGDLSIPGMLSGLTGATTYNIGYGGASASLCESTTSSLSGMLNALFNKEPSFFPEHLQAHTDVLNYQTEGISNSNIYYILNYGLNDYFYSCPISSADPYDITTYSGAIRSSILEIRKHSPGAEIVLCTPTYTSLIPNPQNPLAFEEYVDTILRLADEMNVKVADTYHLSGITQQNHTQYLSDGVHPNEAGRFLIGKCILQTIRP